MKEEGVVANLSGFDEEIIEKLEKPEIKQAKMLYI